MVGKNIFNSQLTWDTSQVTTMNGMFWGEDAFNHHLVWDTSRVKSMRFMFYGASDFNQQLAWDTSKVTDMDHMFYNASDFNQQLVWDTGDELDEGHVRAGVRIQAAARPGHEPCVAFRGDGDRAPLARLAPSRRAHIRHRSPPHAARARLVARNLPSHRVCPDLPTRSSITRARSATSSSQGTSPTGGGSAIERREPEARLDHTIAVSLSLSFSLHCINSKN